MNTANLSLIPNQQQSVKSLAPQYLAVRQQSETICGPLVTEDYCIQTMPDVSPPKWHLAHTSWFFETFLLKPYLDRYPIYHKTFDCLFNSYYETVGKPYPRSMRGFLSRPTVDDIYQYRHHIDKYMQQLLANPPTKHYQDIIQRTTIGIHHEQQHQELLLTDIKHIFASNPLKPHYKLSKTHSGTTAVPKEWLAFEKELRHIGHRGHGFAFDNETPSHLVFLQDFCLATKLVTNGEYLEFIESGGYTKSDTWLSAGWTLINNNNWHAPLYWEKLDGNWWHMTLSGMQKIDPNAPVCHVSFFEADSFARWSGKRLPTEAEWEVAASQQPIAGDFYETNYLQPIAADKNNAQLYGDVWEWTQSAYAPYPGFQPLSGSLGEYNGKFMCQQMVLRGGSCVTPQSHIRPTYRNFFYPDDRWQFSGIRLADN